MEEELRRIGKQASALFCKALEVQFNGNKVDLHRATGIDEAFLSHCKNGKYMRNRQRQLADEDSRYAQLVDVLELPENFLPLVVRWQKLKYGLANRSVETRFLTFRVHVDDYGAKIHVTHDLIRTGGEAAFHVDGSLIKVTITPKPA